MTTVVTAVGSEGEAAVLGAWQTPFGGHLTSKTWGFSMAIWRFVRLPGGYLEDHPINPRTRKWVSVRIRVVGRFQNDLFMAYKWW